MLPWVLFSHGRRAGQRLFALLLFGLLFGFLVLGLRIIVQRRTGNLGNLPFLCGGQLLIALFVLISLGLFYEFLLGDPRNV